MKSGWIYATTCKIPSILPDDFANGLMKAPRMKGHKFKFIKSKSGTINDDFVRELKTVVHYYKVYKVPRFVR